MESGKLMRYLEQGLLYERDLEELVEDRKTKLERTAVKLHLLLCSDKECKLLSPESDLNYTDWVEKARQLCYTFSVSIDELAMAVNWALSTKGDLYGAGVTDLMRILLADSIGRSCGDSIQNLNEVVESEPETELIPDGPHFVGR